MHLNTIQSMHKIRLDWIFVMTSNSGSYFVTLVSLQQRKMVLHVVHELGWLVFVGAAAAAAVVPPSASRLDSSLRRHGRSRCLKHVTLAVSVREQQQPPTKKSVRTHPMNEFKI